MGSVGVLVRVAVCAFALGACASIHNDPVNLPLEANASAQAELGRNSGPPDDDLFLALSFSGGGTRAAAFSHGVMVAMYAARARGGSPAASNPRARPTRTNRL